MMKGISFNMILLLLMWGAKVCLATEEKECDVPLGAEQRNEKAARGLALSILEECKDGVHGVRMCMVGFVRSHSLEPRSSEAVEGFKKWKCGLVNLMEIVEKFEMPGYNPDEWEAFGQGPYIHELNRCCKNAYDACIGSFKGALSQFCCYMKSADFFPDLLDNREKMSGRSTDLGSLRDAMVWRRDDIARIYGKYNDEASKVSVLAREIRQDFLRRMERSLTWKGLVSRRKELFDNQDNFFRGRLIELIFRNKQETNGFMLKYLTENDKERWESLIRSVEPILGYEPLANDGNTNSLDGFDGLVAHLMRHVKKRHTAQFQSDHEALFREDANFLRFLNGEMHLILLENALNRKGTRIPEAGNSGEFYN